MGGDAWTTLILSSFLCSILSCGGHSASDVYSAENWCFWNLPCSWSCRGNTKIKPMTLEDLELTVSLCAECTFKCLSWKVLPKSIGFQQCNAFFKKIFLWSQATYCATKLSILLKIKRTEVAEDFSLLLFSELTILKDLLPKIIYLSDCNLVLLIQFHSL